MKKLFALISIVLLACSTISAQVALGVRGGLSTNLGTKASGEIGNTLVKSNMNQNASTMGFNAGAYASIPVSDTFFIQPEIIYNTSNGIEFHTQSMFTYIKVFEFSTIDIPVLFGYTIQNGSFAVLPFAGPQLSVAMGKMKYRGIYDDNSISEKGEFDIPSIAWGFVAGCGVTYPVTGSMIVGADIRYAMDFNETSIILESETMGVLKRRGLSVNASVGYRF